MATRHIVAVANSTERDGLIRNAGIKFSGIAFQRDTNTLYVYDPDATGWIAIGGVGGLSVAGIAAGYKVARGEHTQVAASDTVVTSLATVISVVCSPRTRTVKQLFFNASPGDQAGTPAAGSILITSQKPTAVNDVTPIAATDFTDNIAVDWIAIGT